MSALDSTKRVWVIEPSVASTMKAMREVLDGLVASSSRVSTPLHSIPARRRKRVIDRLDEIEARDWTLKSEMVCEIANIEGIFAHRLEGDWAISNPRQ